MSLASVLVVFSSVHGHTRHVAEHVAGALRSSGLGAQQVSVRDAEAVDLEHVVGVVVVVPVHHRRHDGAMVAWMARHRELVDRVPSLVLSVSIAAAGTDEASRAEARGLLTELVLRANVSPSLAASIGGSVNHDGVPFFARAGQRDEAERCGLRVSAQHDTDLTDWSALERLERRFVDLLGDGAAPAPGTPTARSRTSRTVSSGSVIGLGTIRRSAPDPALVDVTAPVPSSPVPELSTGDARITCRPLTDPSRLREVVDGVASIPGVETVTLESAVGDHAVLRVVLERPVALGAELLTHLARQITGCRFRDGGFEIDLAPHSADRAT